MLQLEDRSDILRPSSESLRSPYVKFIGDILLDPILTSFIVSFPKSVDQCCLCVWRREILRLPVFLEGIPRERHNIFWLSHVLALLLITKYELLKGREGRRPLPLWAPDRSFHKNVREKYCLPTWNNGHIYQQFSVTLV